MTRARPACRPPRAPRGCSHRRRRRACRPRASRPRTDTPAGRDDRRGRAAVGGRDLERRRPRRRHPGDARPVRAPCRRELQSGASEADWRPAGRVDDEDATAALGDVGGVRDLLPVRRPGRQGVGPVRRQICRAPVPSVPVTSRPFDVWSTTPCRRARPTPGRTSPSARELRASAPVVAHGEQLGFRFGGAVAGEEDARRALRPYDPPAPAAAPPTAAAAATAMTPRRNRLPVMPSSLESRLLLLRRTLRRRCSEPATDP